MLAHGILSQMQYAVPAAAGGVITANLEQWLDPINNGGSTSAWGTDVSGNGRDVSSIGSDWSWNASGYVEITSGTSQANTLINLNYLPTLNGVPWSFDYWAWPGDGKGISSDLGLLHNRPNTETQVFWHVAVYYDPSVGANKPLRQYITDSANNLESFTTGGSDNWKVWNHFAFTYDGSGTIKGYTNGVFRNSISATLGAMNTDPTLYIAGPTNGRPAGEYWNDLKWGGYRVYSAELSSEDVLNNYDVEKGHYGIS